MRSSTIATLTIVVLASLINVFGQNEQTVEEWKAAYLAKLSPENRAKYEKLERANFAQIELARKLPAQDEPEETVNRPFRVGEEIYFRLLSKNISGEKVLLPYCEMYYCFQPRLVKDGETVAYKREATEAIKGLTFEIVPRKATATAFNSNQTLTASINLKYWYEPLQPGQYQLTVSQRFVWAGDWLESQPLSFEVLPGENARGPCLRTKVVRVP
jgi:hypothetical protein